MPNGRIVDYTVNGHDVAPAPVQETQSLKIEAARALIEEERQARAAACMAEINQVLERYGCAIIAQTLVQAR